MREFSKKYIHIGTNEALNSLIQLQAFALGWHWAMGSTEINTDGLHCYKDNYCLGFNGSGNLMYSPISFYEKEGYTAMNPSELIKPVQAKVKLNGEYEAIVTATEVKVGCQTFPASIIQELVEAHKSLTQ
jgi:hypothetical protein